MAAPTGWFDPQTLIVGWFDPILIDRPAWWDEEQTGGATWPSPPASFNPAWAARCNVLVGPGGVAC